MKCYDLVIINRSFWPIYPVIGEGLLRLAESLAKNKKIAVITQNHSDIKKNLVKFNRGFGVKFFLAWALSDSSSNFISRVIDSLFFSLWVLITLIRTKPKKIYVSTDPPILVPFIVLIYSKFFKTEYFYHLQDIHPETTNVIFKLNPIIFNLLKKIDNFTISNASQLIILNEKMASEIDNRLKIKINKCIIENPSVEINESVIIEKKKGFSFTGNHGRLQRIPLLIDAIRKYLNDGGALEFSFAGGGIYSTDILKLSKEYSLVNYHGLVSSEDAAFISSSYEWALAPIEDQITRYAFPSKLSSYACTGAKILAICNDNTSVSKWVKEKKVGISAKPLLEELVDIFFKIENNELNVEYNNSDREKLKNYLSMNNFVKNLKSKLGL